MQFPKLTQLQSRFAASLTASLILLFVYLSLSKPHFAYATELDSRISSDHNHPIILDVDFSEDLTEEQNVGSTVFKIQNRQTSGALVLLNNAPQNKDISVGETQNWILTTDVINGPAGESGRGLPSESRDVKGDQYTHSELKKRQAGKQVYISVNTCLQPVSVLNSTDPDTPMPPQLLLYYSQSASNQNPGPSSTGDQQNITFDGGYALVNITTDSDVYIGIAATNATGLTGSWNYEIAASIDAPYHSVEEETPFLHFVDGDTHAALLITDNLTQALPNSTAYQEWMQLPPPYGMLGQTQDDPYILGVSKSYCGLMHNALIVDNLENVQNQNTASITNRGGKDAKPKQQFYVTALNASSLYWGFLAMQGNSTASGLSVVGGGGKVWPRITFSTKTESNCALMYNLSFCSEVAYAVPTNPDLFSPRGGLPALAQLYDNNAQQLYQYFNYSLQQIPCNTTFSAQYSLAQNCDDCAHAYKQWLCAVTIPRCEDFTNPAPYLKARNVAQPFPNGSMADLGPDGPFLMGAVATNQSRNALIDSQIKPGPYKEVLPCDDLCYDLVRSCPAALQFGCPLRGAGLSDSYGFMSSDPNEITCSYLGAAYGLSAAPGGLAVGPEMKFLVVFMLGLGLAMGV